jgi:hypothetical protein
MLGAGLRIDCLVRGRSGGDQHHAIEFELKVRLLGADQVAKVWRIERPAHDSHTHR